MSLHRRPRLDDETVIELTPEDAGWEWAGLRVLTLRPGSPRRLTSGSAELIVLPLRGSMTVVIDHQQHHLEGRSSVFSGSTDFLYIGRETAFTLTSATVAEVALPSSLCTQTRDPRYGRASDVPTEVRGEGGSTRLVRNFAVPGVWEHAEKLICCELITPPGNWSSYPPHKHDASEPCDVVNEEIYYYRIAGPDQQTPSPKGFGYHRTYTGPEHEKAGLPPLDELIEVRDQDVVLVPYGYHGPCTAAPGYPMYYLNVMAGPGDRAMAFCDDPDHAWVRSSWTPAP